MKTIIVGHLDVSTTMNVYVHSTRDAKRKSVRLLGKSGKQWLRKFPYFPCDYLIGTKIRETTYHFTNEQAGKPIKWGKLER